MKFACTHLTAAACLIAMLAIPAALAEPGTMMHMTLSGQMQMSDPPMTMAIPTTNHDVCSPQQVDVRRVMAETSRNKQCTYTNYKQVGNTVTFHYACSGTQKVDGDGTFTLEANGMHGSVHANADMGGNTMKMDMNYQGTRTGAACDYTPPKAAE